MAAVAPPVGFALTVPESWYELDVRPATRDASIRALVESRVRGQPELWEHRNELIRVLRRQARDAAEAGAVYCACFVIVAGESIVPGSLSVSVIPSPPGGTGVDAVAESLPAKEAAADGEPWMTRRVVDIPRIGRVARSEGVTDVELPGGRGWIRTIVMRTFVPVDAQRLLLVTAASPALDLTEPLLDLFDAVSGTITLVGADG